MLDKKDTTLIKLDCKSKDKVYDLLFGKADACLKNAKTVALLYLGSPYYMTRALEEYNIEEVNIFTTKDFKFIYEPFENAERAKIWYVDNVKDTFKECDMKFDCIIMNPPYGRSLPHNILNIASKYLKDDKSVVVSLQPATPYQTFVESTKVTKENMSHIKDIEIIQADKASEIFGITVRSDLGIIQIDNSIHDYKYQFNECKPIYDKIINKKLKSWRSVCVYDQDPKHFLYMNGDNGYAKGWHLKPTEIFNGKTNAKLVFNSKEEKDNFFNSVKNTWLYKFIYILDNDAAVPAHFPFMQDYSKPWDDARFYKFFNITPEEQKVIEETMEKYK